MLCNRHCQVIPMPEVLEPQVENPGALHSLPWSWFWRLARLPAPSPPHVGPPAHVLPSRPQAWEEKDTVGWGVHLCVSPWPPWAWAVALREATAQPPPSTLSRSPPRPSPGSLHYSDEDVTKYNDLIQAESSSLTEKPSEISDSQVRRWRTRCPGEGSGAALSQSAALLKGPSHERFPPFPYGPQRPQETTQKSYVGQLPSPMFCSEFAPRS